MLVSALARLLIELRVELGTFGERLVGEGLHLVVFQGVFLADLCFAALRDCLQLGDIDGMIGLRASQLL